MGCHPAGQLSLPGVSDRRDGPSSILTLITTRWCQKNRDRTIVQAFRQGLAPIVVAVAGDQLDAGAISSQPARDWKLWVSPGLHHAGLADTSPHAVAAGRRCTARGIGWVQAA